MTCSEDLVISIINLTATILLCAFAGYSTFISRRISQAAIKELEIKSKPLLTSKVLAANKSDDDGLTVQMQVSNQGQTDIQLNETKVHLINLLKFRADSDIEIIKDSPIDYESLYLPPQSETAYDFHITKDAYEMMKSEKLGILSVTRYTSNGDHEGVLNLVTHYGRINNSLGTYKIWRE